MLGKLAKAALQLFVTAAFMIQYYIILLRALLHKFIQRPLLSHSQLLPSTLYQPWSQYPPHFKTEFHEFVTSDGYILQVVRLQKGQSKGQPLLLMHGLLDCGLTWVLKKSRQDQLPFILAEEGFDVWIGNSRGAKHSEKHIRLDSSDEEYWKFSLDQLALYDVPALVEGILRITQSEKLSWVGHSQGFTQLVLAISKNPQINGKLQKLIGLGPVMSIGHGQLTLLQYLNSFRILQFIKWLGFHSILKLPERLNRGTGQLIYLSELYQKTFLWIVNFICGIPVRSKIDRDFLGTIIAQQPGGSSIRNLMQWGQFYKDKQLRMFDFGEPQNLRIYKSERPPKYNLENIGASLKKEGIKVKLFMGTADILYNEEDWQQTRKILGFPESQLLQDYNHLQYIWSSKAGKLQRQIVSFLKE